MITVYWLTSRTFKHENLMEIIYDVTQSYQFPETPTHLSGPSS